MSDEIETGDCGLQGLLTRSVRHCLGKRESVMQLRTSKSQAAMLHPYCRASAASQMVRKLQQLQQFSDRWGHNLLAKLVSLLAAHDESRHLLLGSAQEVTCPSGNWMSKCPAQLACLEQHHHIHCLQGSHAFASGLLHPVCCHAYVLSMTGSLCRPCF